MTGINGRGQSTIEFLLTFAFTLGILFLFIKLALNATAGYMIHYATFMASRTYLVFDNGSKDSYEQYAAEKALAVFNKYNQKGFIINPANFGINSQKDFQDRQKKLYVGAHYTFTQRLSILPMVGGATQATLVSESFLGKEPSRIQCKIRICEIMQKKLEYPTGDCKDTPSHFKHLTLFDDGC